MLGTLLFAGALVGQAALLVDPDCRDDKGTDRCSAENRADVLRMLAMTSIEDESAAGAEIYRVMQVDGYGDVMPAIAFERRLGTSPRVVVYARNGKQMSALVPPADWTAVRRLAQIADRNLAPVEDADAEKVVCAHAWIHTVEIAEVAQPGAARPDVRRRTESTCGDDGMATRFSYELISKALTLFPDCSYLDPIHYRNDASRLRACVNFEGDRLAAADLMNQIDWEIRPESEGDRVTAWAEWIGQNIETRLDWGGRKFTGSGGPDTNAVAIFLAQQHADEPTLAGYLNAFNGVSSSRVETAGNFEMRESDDQILYAPFEQVWVLYSPRRGWVLESWTVEAFAPAP